MTLSQDIVTFSVPLNDRPQDLVDLFNAYFLGRPVFIQSVDFSRLQSPYRSDEIQLRVAFVEASGDGIGWSYDAVIYETDIGSPIITAQEKYNDAFIAGLCKTPAFFEDLTDHEQDRAIPDILLVIQVDTPVASFSKVYVAEPGGDIAAGASGAATLYDAGGTIVGAGVTIYNGDVSNSWPTGQRAFVYWDPQEGNLVGIPTDCGTAALAITPTAAPSTDVPCISRELPTTVNVV